MAKLTIPRLRYLAQDADGEVAVYQYLPTILYGHSHWTEEYYSTYVHITKGKTNPNWQESIIDLDTDEHEFEDGILRRIDK